MSERKNLDKLFQEKFKDFEASAPQESWPYIEEKLKEKKKRRVIPIWWKLSGIAAALLIVIAVADGFLHHNAQKSDTVVIKENPGGKPENANGNPMEKNDSTETAVASSNTEDGGTKNIGGSNDSDSGSNNQSVVSGNSNGNLKPNLPTNANNGVVANDKTQSQTTTVKTSPQNNRKVLRSFGKEQQLVSREKSDTKNSQSVKNRTFKINSKTQNTAVQNQQLASNNGKVKNKAVPLKATLSSENNEALSNPKTNTTLNNVYQDEKAGQETDSKIAQQNQTNLKAENKDNTTIGQPINNTPIANDKKTADKTQLKKIDSTAIATVVPNALEELLNEKENNLVAKGPQINRWQITSSVAPIYLGSTSAGSPIDSSFTGNSKSYKTSMSVKLGVNYAISKKFTVRTGISQVTLDYNTNDVLISAGMNRNSLENVQTSSQNQFLHFARRSAPQTTAAVSAAGSNLASDQFSSSLNQRMGYLEVPLEVSYAVFDKKFGLNIIGGLSTLFLNENKIIVISEGLTTNLGEANNLNKTHFSTNLGLGMRYRFYKAFQANFEPMFKYQINTFSKENGNFKPYYFGLYTGISYSF